MKKYLVLLVLLLTITGPGRSEDRLLLMAGAASAPVLQELVEAFAQKTGIGVDISIGGSGTLLSQIKLSRKGDLYFPASIDFIEKAIAENLIDAATVTPVTYLVPAICVLRGNPQGLKSLRDLGRPGLKIAIAQPESVAIGAIAVEMLENFLSREEKAAVKKNIVTYTQNVEKTANALVLRSVDGVIAWRVIEKWKPHEIESVRLPAEEIVRISYMAVAITRYSRNRAKAQKFIDFLKTDGLTFFQKAGYFTDVNEAYSYIGIEKPVGGQPYQIPGDWLE